MADLKVTQLDPATTLTGSEVVYVVQGGQSRRTTLGAALAVNHAHALAQITDAGSAAALNVPASAGAEATAAQVVRGDDPRLGAAGAFTDRGSVSGVVTVDMAGARDVTQAMVLVGDASIAITNAPLAFATLTLHVAQDASGGHALALPGTSAFLNGSDGSIDPAANGVSLLTLATIGGSAWLVAISDTRGLQYDSFYGHPLASRNVDFGPLQHPVTLNLAGVRSSGAGSLAYHKGVEGTFAAVTGVTHFEAGTTFRVVVTTTSGISFTVPRIG